MTLKDDIAKWRNKTLRTIRRGIDSAATQTPAIIADLAGGSDTIGKAMKGVMESLGADTVIYNSVYRRILSNFSEKINSSFMQIQKGDRGGLSYPVSGPKDSGFLISRAMASLLNTIASPKKSIMTIEQFYLTLLHERVWQCHDSTEFIHQLRQTQAMSYVEEMNKTAEFISELAKDCYKGAMLEISDNEITLASFIKSHPGVDINALIAGCDNDGVLAEKDMMSMAFLILTPKKLIDSYLDVICQPGSILLSYLPYEEPNRAPNRDAPPMLSSVKVKGWDSPGLAVDNVVLIRPRKYLNTRIHEFSDTEWPYGNEYREGFIQLEPPFSLFMDDGADSRPQWVEERAPDVQCVHYRNHVTDYADYDEYSSLKNNSFDPI